MKTLFALFLSLLIPSVLLAQDISSVTRLSQDATGAGAIGQVSAPVVAPNGRRMAFATTAQLVSEDQTSISDIYVRNLETGEIRRASVGPQGLGGNGASDNPSISPVSPKGLFVLAYESNATNLSHNSNLFPDTNGNSDIILAFPGLGFFNERISIAPGPIEANGDSSNPSVTVTHEPNKILVAFTSQATNLDGADTDAQRDIYLAVITDIKKDGFNPATDISITLVSRAADSAQQSDGISDLAKISANGRYIVFESTATNLVSGVSPSARQIYLYDVQQGTISLVTKAADGSPGNDDSSGASINFGGTYISYITLATNLINDGKDPGANKPQTVRYNVATGEHERVNVNALGIPSNGTNGSAFGTFVSPDGRFVIFADDGTNLVSDDSGSTFDVLSKDFASGEIRLLSRSAGGTIGDDDSFAPTSAPSKYGASSAFVMYKSQATNLISSDTEGNVDIFNAEIAIPPVALTRESKLELPPDVQVSDKSIAVSLQSFDGVDLSSSSKYGPAEGKLADAASTNTLRYFVEIKREGYSGAKRDLRRKLVKRNEVSFRNLKSGTYLVRYQARVFSRGKLVYRSAFSPTERISRESDDSV